MKRISRITVKEKPQYWANFVVPLLFGLIGFIISMAYSFSPSESIIISLLISIFSSQVQQSYLNAVKFQKASNDQNRLSEKIDEISTYSDLYDKMKKIPHPYFYRVAQDRFDAFLASNRKLFEGTHETIYNAEDSFIPSSIEYTSDGGTLKVTSNPWNYTDPAWNEKYLELQKKNYH